MNTAEARAEAQSQLNAYFTYCDGVSNARKPMSFGEWIACAAAVEEELADCNSVSWSGHY